MSITITCEECGHRHRLERQVNEPGPIFVVCHNCELPLRAVLETGTTPAAAPTDYKVWSTVFGDVSTPTTTSG